MAEVEKFTDDSVDMLLRHAERQLKNDANKNIVAEKKTLIIPSNRIQTDSLPENFTPRFLEIVTCMAEAHKGNLRPSPAAAGLLLFQSQSVTIRLSKNTTLPF